MRHARARLEKATVLREIVGSLVLASPSGVVLECEHVFFHELDIFILLE